MQTPVQVFWDSPFIMVKLIPSSQQGIVYSDQVIIIPTWYGTVKFLPSSLHDTDNIYCSGEVTIYFQIVC